MPHAGQPLLVFGPRSPSYDFGPGHPLTPRRFGPGIDLLQALGAQPGLAPEPTSDAALVAVHEPGYIEIVRQFSASPLAPPRAGIGPGDVPAFGGMHDAAAAVAGGSLRAMEAILGGEVEHAFHPGGGLHHAMPARASGFCVYNDPALAIAHARAAGERVLYLDFDVHHGDGVEAIHGHDPGVVTFSIHESGQYLFPGSGFIGVDDEGSAAGTTVNVPLEPATGAAPWLAAIERLVPELAAVFGPDVLVTQHGSDAHAWDPLAHLAITTTAMGAAARLADRIAHRYAAGRWLATGGGGYDVYRVVPRAWALVWLAAAHQPVPPRLPTAWRDRWAEEAARFGAPSVPTTFEDDPAVGRDQSGSAGGDRRTDETVELARALAVPALVRHAVEAGWWSPESAPGSGSSGTAASTAYSGAADAAGSGRPRIVANVDAARWSRLRLRPRVVSPADPADAQRLIAGALAAPSAGAVVTAAIAGPDVVGLVVSALDPAQAVRRLLAVGVAPAWRREGLGDALLAAHLSAADARAGDPGTIQALVTVAERDVVEPEARSVRRIVARRLLEGAGFAFEPVRGAIGRADPSAIVATRRR